MRLNPRGICRIAAPPWLKQAVPFVHTPDFAQKLNTSGDTLASLCAPPVLASRAELPGSTRCQRRFQPQRSFLTPSLTSPGKNNPAEEGKRVCGCSAFHPTPNQHLPRAPGEDAPARAAEGFWLPPSRLTSAKSFPYQRCAASLPAQQPYRGERCPWAVPNGSIGLSKVTHQRNVPCITRAVAAG